MALSDYEEALQSYIHDDDKLVTYKWLSKELEIHVNAAKDVLKQYYEKFKNKETLVATFLLIGQLKDRSIRVEVVKDSKLESSKEKFVKIDCQHFYSLQKCLSDIELLASSGEDLRYSAIKCNEDYVRNEEEIESLRYVGNPKKDNEVIVLNKITNKATSKSLPSKAESPKKKNPVVQNGKKEKTESQDNEKKKKSETKPEESEKLEKKVSPKTNNNSKSNNKVSKKPTQSKQSGFSNLFGKANKSQAPKKIVDDSEDSKPNSLESLEKEEKQKSIEKEEKNKKIQEKGKNIVSTDKDKSSIQEKEKNINSQEKEKNVNSQEKENKSQQCKEKSIKSKNSDKLSSKQNGRGKKRNRSQDNTSRKRKRILVMDSSEDESNQSNDEKEEEEPMEIQQEPPKVIRKRSPSPPTEKHENGKRMVRKTVDKTYQDEDGFLVTKKVHIYEVASDNDETEVKKEEPEKPKPVEKQKKKQTSLMSFFKKS